jgi:uncharacterized protein (DUF305 family)
MAAKPVTEPAIYPPMAPDRYPVNPPEQASLYAPLVAELIMHSYNSQGAKIKFDIPEASLNAELSRRETRGVKHSVPPKVSAIETKFRQMIIPKHTKNVDFMSPAFN